MLRNSLVLPASIIRLPWLPMLLVLTIGSFGALTLFSIAGGSMTPWALRHLMRLLILLGLALCISMLRPQMFRDLTYPAYAALIVALVAVQIFGSVRNGARSWFDLGVFEFQPSEPMKPVLVLALAGFYASVPTKYMRTFSAIWPAALIILLPVGLILLQPDLGTALLLMFSSLTIMFIAGLPIRLFVLGGIAAGAAIPILYKYALLPHQRDRVAIFLNPEQDPLGAGYHIVQSKIAIGSGGLFGKGFLHGSQSQLHFLPEPETDFILAAMVEEWGFVGVLFLMTCYFILFRWGMNVARASKDRFSKLAAIGLIMTIFFYFAINMLMNVGLAPVVGIPLPLFSHGGSSMLTVMLCIGMLMSIDRENRGYGRKL
ncbi:rod shape-determining protein RodA [Sphingomonas spermidinifaciens]|uniref:Peptidoglycan glycosyltransferase MrdB n=1 Tax=Sphingomonas spermidinifaciens TaxID=1141889 RepID=A0A2A4B2S5_9SPHN|nr:rod shape-determining protein RodA [Sphingomonas spermidinifaciens]PCD02265.1 rod shape-determining protein RodA [Sphingomonas spermidinifaciens]